MFGEGVQDVNNQSLGVDCSACCILGRTHV